MVHEGVEEGVEEVEEEMGIEVEEVVESPKKDVNIMNTDSWKIMFLA